MRYNTEYVKHIAFFFWVVTVQNMLVQVIVINIIFDSLYYFCKLITDLFWCYVLYNCVLVHVKNDPIDNISVIIYHLLPKIYMCMPVRCKK